ncbi:hypothetical protein [Stenotrophomonas phage YB07]|uniref:Uncharacterized protein n=1 Tax=Stenotrophomonas phage YB07 TaxID=2555548 RepID=A0A482IEE9_9CAUD|nr:hypothetical protein HWC11_gp041 [Stenotrophomonas phage YB07]QBP06237.1 hypothetical protein [Stenotrophomonas phage YB07]
MDGSHSLRLHPDFSESMPELRILNVHHRDGILGCLMYVDLH